MHYCEIRIDKTLNDANGQELGLKPGAPVGVTVGSRSCSRGTKDSWPVSRESD
jgi:hypothetical protein